MNWRLNAGDNNREDDLRTERGRRFSSAEGITDQPSFPTYSSSRKVPLNVIVMDSDEEKEAQPNIPETLNSKAVSVIQRVSNKLSGRSFN